MAAADSPCSTGSMTARLAVQQDATAFGEADGCLHQAVAAMKTQMETELARADLSTPCPESIGKLSGTLGGAEAVRGRPADPDGQ